jgi:prepilin-type processing-associated H-X9-DG protein
VSTRLKVMECPSAPRPDRKDGAPEAGWTANVATGDYSGIYWSNAQQALPGILSKTDEVRLTDVTDGLSNTIHLTESAAKPDRYVGGRLVQAANGGIRVNGGGWCRPASDVPYPVGLAADGTSPGTGIINVTNGLPLNGYPDPRFGTDGTGQIYAFHSGGANALLGDGSVRFIKASIQAATLEALVTRNAGEVVPNDF